MTPTESNLLASATGKSARLSGPLGEVLVLTNSIRSALSLPAGASLR